MLREEPGNAPSPGRARVRHVKFLQEIKPAHTLFSFLKITFYPSGLWLRVGGGIGILHATPIRAREF